MRLLPWVRRWRVVWVQQFWYVWHGVPLCKHLYCVVLCVNIIGSLWAAVSLQSSWLQVKDKQLLLYTHTHTHACTRTHTHTCTRTHAHTHTHTCTQTHTHTHTHRFSYPSVERTLCPLLNMEDPATSPVIMVDVSTSSPSNLTFTLRASPVQEFSLMYEDHCCLCVSKLGGHHLVCW